MTEFGFIDSILRRFADLPAAGMEGIGDDCAVLPAGGGESLVLTTDLVAEGVHFLRAAMTAEEVGRKALAVNLSDLAAMGARPVATLLALALPADAAEEWAEGFMRGYHDLSKRYATPLIGGDTTRSEGGIVVSVTAIGRMADADIKRRSAARAGDTVLVTDALGASGAGLRDILAGRPDTPLAARHRAPLPQLDQGQWLAGRGEVHAMMDLSDGLASDIRRIAEQSHVGARLDLERIPVAAGATLQDALCGGEDYKLLLTADADATGALCDAFRQRFGTPLYPVGHIEAGSGIVFLRDGVPQRLGWKGFAHFEQP